MNKERRDSDALAAVAAAGAVIGMLAGIIAVASVGFEAHRILLLTSLAVLFSSIAAGILIYRSRPLETEEVAERVSIDR